MRKLIVAALEEARSALEALLADDNALRNVEKAAAILVESMRHDGRAFSCGNGGSMCDAMHFAEELSGRFRKSRPALPALAISDPGHLSCTANDFGWDQVFSRFIEAHGRKNDVLLAISTSGTSPNILRAAQAARDRGLRVVTLTGKVSSPLGSLADVDLCFPVGRFSDRVQELHIKVIHVLIELVERELFPSL